MKRRSGLNICMLTLLLILTSSIFVFANPEGEAHNLGERLPIWSVLPFVGMLLSIAIVPLVKGEWWERNLLKVSIFWSLTFLVPFAIFFSPGESLYQVLEIVLLDYLPFIVLLFGLFVVSGGIVLRGSLAGTPKVNVVILTIGTLLSSWIGTTGASMLLIRPIIRANQWREKKAHIIIFFIFLVSNIGGCLTPIGDPPLFLGFLRHVPFFWTLRLLPLMLFNAVILMIVFFIMDMRNYKREIAAGRSPVKEGAKNEKLRVEGTINFIFVLMIVGAVILSGFLAKMPALLDSAGNPMGVTIYGVTLGWNSIIQMAIILFAAFLSMKFTSKKTREDNFFTYGPIKEVAELFIGIFLTMIPALALLGAHGSSLGLEKPSQFFWATGLLSSFLDNAPTYLVFMTTAGSLGATAGLATTVGVIAPKILVAVSAGAVFMGANTYIGNAPNFMVRSIAEENKIKMPSFFGYMGWSILFLIPLFVLNTLIFF
ncbi:MAG: sodium:proton antiporter [Anaerovoracaceae bacterium]